ncbi:predicted protein [Sclerotinia sclerotiorum 1980 UF-70]|uniref:Uncharacterized protein n=1 Tax=Sclerotinia sclerotiorum (strain ATCC 18683 / 1980 / Ss-1) TaxID=665079 RepID=A7ETM6_SCLS1|nr:predicted protein [Sclerotinia sclerotiorum 1980 UF-70]EDN92818.1 predicted protein [Sclerotinia sclerotiorum 1980 UF-70]
MVGPKQMGHSGQKKLPARSHRSASCKCLAAAIMIGRIALSKFKDILKGSSFVNHRSFFRLITMSLSLHSCHSTLLLRPLRSPRKTSTPGVDHVSGRNKPVNFA